MNLDPGPLSKCLESACIVGNTKGISLCIVTTPFPQISGGGEAGKSLWGNLEPPHDPVPAPSAWMTRMFTFYSLTLPGGSRAQASLSPPPPLPRPVLYMVMLDLRRHAVLTS